MQSNGRLPSEVAKHAPDKVACFDGDADRLCYVKRHEKAILVINGDKIFAFLMMYIVEKLEILQV